jgi:hypothetical protein
LEKYIPHVYLPFIDDISVKKPKTIYNNKKIVLGIRRYILEYIIWIDRVLTNLKRVRYTISGVKSQFYMLRFRVMEFIYNALRRYFNTFKVIKIIKWLFPNNIAEARIFIKMAVYYKMFIKNFTFVAASIYSLIRKEIRFAWD